MKKLLLIGLLSLSLYAETMQELINYATQQSSVIKQRQADLTLAALKRQESHLQKFGEINAVGDYTHYNIERTLAPLVPSAIVGGSPVTTSKDIFSAGIRYSVPLFTGFAQTRQVEIDEIAQTLSHIRLQLSKEELAFNIRSLYLAILAQKEILQAQKRYSAALQRLSRQTAYEVKLGKKAQIDLLKVRSDLETSRMQESVISTNIETTKASLWALVGKKVKKIEPLKIKVSKPRYRAATLYKRISALSKVKAEEMALKKAQKLIEKSNAAKLPQVNLAAYAGKNYGEDIATGKWDNETLWQVGVNVSYNLVDFGKRDIATQKAKIARMQAVFKKEQTLLDLKKLITQGVEKLKQRYAEYKGNLSRYALSKKAQEIEAVRYNNDASTMNDLLLAKAKTWLAQAKLIESKYNYQKSKYYIDYLMERGVESE